jgi:large subunit ribosomal protein L19
MNNWEIYNAENMIGDPEISEMEFYSTMTEDEKNSKVDDTSEEASVETNSEEEVEEKSTDSKEETPVEEAPEEAGAKPVVDQVEESEVELEDTPKDTSKETPVETNSEEEVEEKSTDSETEESTTDEVAKETDEAPTEIEMDPETAAKMAMQTKVVQATYTDIRNDLPEFHSGDTISVGYRVIEGSRSRIQSFDGVVIKISSGHGLDKTFTVRKISGGIGVERIFPFHSPNIISIKVLKTGKVRRAKLYYLRRRKGKATRIREKTQ